MHRPGTVAELLHFLIRRMDDDLEAGVAGITPPALLRLDGADVACAVDGVDLHAKVLDGHPVDVLVGFTAPPEWFGVGVLVTGTAHEPGPKRRRMRMTTMVCRDGTEASAFRVVGEDLRFPDEPGQGMVRDTLRRVLGLPTDPPDVSIDEWMARLWLEIIRTVAKRGKRARKLDWNDAAAAHPAVVVTGSSPEDIAKVAPETAAAMRWERLRLAEANEGNELAAWMDEGMFARWSVYGRPPMDELLGRARRRLTPDGAAKVEATLAGWGLVEDPASAA